MLNVSSTTRETEDIGIFIYLDLIPTIIFKFCIFNFLKNIRLYLFLLSIDQKHKEMRIIWVFLIGIGKCC